MLKIIVVVIGIIAVVGFIMTCYFGSVIDELKRQADSLDILTIKKFDPYTKTWDLNAEELRRLKKALREQGIATDYTSERKLDFSECKKTDEEYKKEADSLVNSVKVNQENFEDLTVFEEVEVVTLKDPRERQFRCKKCSTVYPINITLQSNVLQSNVKYCSFCGKKIAYFKFLDIWKG